MDRNLILWLRSPDATAPNLAPNNITMTSFVQGNKWQQNIHFFFRLWFIDYAEIHNAATMLAYSQIMMNRDGVCKSEIDKKKKHVNRDIGGLF